MEVPIWYDAAAVLRVWRQGRKSLLIGKRLRPIKPRIAAMIAFVCERLNEDGRLPGGWQAACSEWNERQAACPEWQYADWRRMCSDFKRSERSLLGRPMDVELRMTGGE